VISFKAARARRIVLARIHEIDEHQGIVTPRLTQERARLQVILAASYPKPKMPLTALERAVLTLSGQVPPPPDPSVAPRGSRR
jgi:hypothetical protein